jgi:hypothetical protein
LVPLDGEKRKVSMAATRATTKVKGGRLPPPAAGSRLDIIRTVQSPLGFFVLVVLVVEAIIGGVAGFSGANERLYIISIMAGIVILLVLTVTSLAWFRPEALEGKRAPVLAAARVQGPELPVVKSPKTLVAVSEQLMGHEMGSSERFTRFGTGFYGDIEAVRQLGGPDPHIVENVTSNQLRDLMVRESFDIVLLLVYVDQQTGQVVFSENDRMNADGFAELVILTRARLVILAVCNSLTLAAVISRLAKVNVIAAASFVTVADFVSWEGTFFSVLAQKSPVSQAFDIACRVSGLQLDLMLKADLAFDAS